MSEKLVTSQKFFIDREHDIKKLAAVLDKINDDRQSRFVFISGQAGIGKTSLVRYFLSTLDQDKTMVLAARGYEEQGSPLFCFIEMIKEFLSDHKIITKGELLDSILNLAKLIPVLEPYVESAQQIIKTVRGLTDMDRFSLADNHYVFSNYLSVLQKISNKKSLVIFIDDVQWLDKTSAELLGYLLRKIEGRIMVIVSHRSGFVTTQKEQESSQFFDGLVKISPQRSIAIKLDPIPEVFYPKFIEGYLGPHKFDKNNIRILHKRTDGNPFFLKSILGMLKDSEAILVDTDGFFVLSENIQNTVPQNLSETLNKRLRKVYSDIAGSREILSYASVIGHQFDVELLAGFLNKDNLEVYHVLQDVEERYGVVIQVENTTTFAFDHRSTQETIYAGLGQLAIDCHKKIAKFLETQQTENPFLVSFHYYRAKEWDDALHWLHISAKTASESYFFSDAVKQYEQCFKLMQQKGIKMPESDLTMLKLGYARSLIGSGCTSTCITNLNSLLGENLSEDQRADALLLLGRCYRFEGSGDSGTRAIKSLEESLKIYENLSRYDRLAEVNSYLATVYDHFGFRKKGVKCFEKSQICYNLANDNIGIARLQRKSGIIYESRRAIEFMKNALDTFDKYSMKIEKARCLNNIGAESFYVGQFAQAEQYLASSVELFRTLDSPEVDIPLNNIGLAYQHKKEYAKALQFFEDANSNASEPFNEIFIKMNMANIFRQTGDLERAKQTIVHLEPLVMSYPENVLNDYYGYNRSRLHFELTEFDQAEEWLLKFPANNYKDDNELILAKRLKMLAMIYEKMGKPSEDIKQKSMELFKTARPQKWFYELDYYPCDIHIWD